MDRSGAHSLRFLPQKELRFIAVVPDQPLSTHKARQAIPQHIPHQDAVFNASRTAPVSYTHLTLPTIYAVQISGGAISLKKKHAYS